LQKLLEHVEQPLWRQRVRTIHRAGAASHVPEWCRATGD